MRPDLDDFEDLNTDGEVPASRTMSWVVLGVAVVGFAALAYYAYQSGTQSLNNGNLMVVEADNGPIKEVPADPGGEAFPQKDKTIYDAIAPSQDHKIEKLLPESEEPVIPEPAVQAATPTTAPAAAATGSKETATTYVNKNVPSSAEETDEAAEANDNGVPDVKAAPAPAKKEIAKEEAPLPVAKPEVKEAPKKEEPKPAAASSGSYQVQLGAFKSDAEAEANWKKISGKHGAVLTGGHTVVSADVKGVTYYRLRATGFDSESAAKAACAKLTAAGQACFYAK